MNRRDILKYTAYATGAVVSVPIASSILSGCESNAAENANNSLHFFSNAEHKLVRSIVDVILPKTDSPSASDVGVDKMIDLMVGTVYTTKDKAAYRSKFDQLYSKLSQTNNLKDDIMQLEQSQNGELSHAYLTLKQQTIAYYLTTEEVGKNHLNYLPVPGEFEACIDIDENTKAWAI